MEKKSALQRLHGDNYKLQSSNDSTNKYSEDDFKKAWLYGNFLFNGMFLPIKEEADKRLNPLFDQWKILLANEEMRKELENNKTKIRDVFYSIVFERIVNDERAMKTLEIVNDAKKKEGGKLTEDDLPVEYQSIIIKAGMREFIEIINEMFEIPRLILTTFQKTSSEFKSTLVCLKKKYNKDHKRALVMTGKKLKEKDKMKYLKVLEKQKELISIHGRSSRKSLLPSAIRAEHKLLSPKKINSMYRTIRYHQEKGNLPK